jgi:hypothetical protein
MILSTLVSAELRGTLTSLQRGHDALARPLNIRHGEGADEGKMHHGSHG